MKLISRKLSSNASKLYKSAVFNISSLTGVQLLTSFICLKASDAASEVSVPSASYEVLN